MEIDADDARAAGAALHLGARCPSPACSRARTQRFIMFLPDGTPVRARLQVTLQRVPQRRARGEGGQARDRRLHQAPRRRPGRDARRDRRRRLRRPAAVAADRACATSIDDPRPRSAVGALLASRRCPTAIPTPARCSRDGMTIRATRPSFALRDRRRAGAGGAARRRSPRVSLRDRRSRAPTASRSRSPTRACAGSTIRCSRSTRALDAGARLRAGPARRRSSSARSSAHDADVPERAACRR